MKECLCCGAPVKVLCEVDYCGSLCRRGKCDHHRKAPKEDLDGQV